MDRSPSCVKKGFNRRAWSACEDRILTSHINTHGEGKWGDISQKAGLKRCGRSCRFRWFNYLRPDIKRGNISMEEEDLIIKIQRLLGNRWSLIAGSLPGRTDNEIKNYWNTNLRKKMKAKTAQKQQKNSKEKKPEGMSSVQPHQVIRTKAMRCTKVFIPPQEVNQSMAKNVAPARDGTRQYDEYLKFLMDLDANELFIPDILNSDLLQVYRDETLEDDSVIGDDSGANYMSSCSTNAAIIENFNAYDSLHEPNAALELKRSVVTFLESDDEWLKRL